MNHWSPQICWPDQEKKKKKNCSVFNTLKFLAVSQRSTVCFGGAQIITLKKKKREKGDALLSQPSLMSLLFFLSGCVIFCFSQIPVSQYRADGGELRSDVWLCGTKQQSYLRNAIWEGKSVNTSRLTMIHPPCLQMPVPQEVNWLFLNRKLVQSPNFPSS